MRLFINMTADELNVIAENPSTPVHDLIILRMLKDMRDYGNLQTIMFYFDIVFGGAKTLGGVAGGGEEGEPVKVFEIPANGSEYLDDEEGF